MTDDDIIREIIRREGGYVDDPADPGGPTRYGITLFTLRYWRKRDVTAADVQGLTEAEAREIYRALYLEKPAFAKYVSDPELRGLLVDSAVNHGPRDAVKFLQRAVGAVADGILGPQSFAAMLRAGSARRIYFLVLAERIAYSGRIITDLPRRSKFAAGWSNRAAEFLRAAA